MVDYSMLIQPMRDVAAGACQARVDLPNDEREKSSRFNIWAAAVAVQRMCVKEGLAGFAYTEGTS